ncbi:putative deacetylase LmbE-like domain-containing protein, partial [Scleroderma citrinum]
RILLLTAHPDDECFFFSPTILAFQEDALRPEIYSLCLSTGNAEGLGEMRRMELGRSLDIMGVEPDKRWVVDHPLLQDNITMKWDASVIASVIAPYVVDNNITAILTFDAQGISSHPNHYSLPLGASCLVHSLSLTRSNTKIVPRVFGLVTVPVLPKYLGIGSVLFTRLKILLGSSLSYFTSVGISPPMAVFTSGFKEYWTATRALREHNSQMLWFRYLYMTFSRYLWVNEWVEI